ncbi:MAG: hypothetical protein RBR19_17055 [Sedimentisphaerales bacterium]|nr:hypothetical protein [Sedimentisphaerales bacterium]
MSENLYRVHVVVDPEYGERLRELPVDEPVWVVASEVNRLVVQALWRERADVTSFRFTPQAAPEDRLVSILSTVDLHHGEFSHDPPYSVLNIIGVEWSPAIQDEFDSFGLNRFEATAEGFVAMRTPSKA